MGNTMGEGKRVDGRKEGRGEDWIGRGYGDGGWGERRGEVDTPTKDPLTGGHANNRSADGLRLRTSRYPEDRFKWWGGGSGSTATRPFASVLA